jgi:hypothetical protein
MYEDSLDPWSHFMGCWRPEVNIQDNDGDTDGQSNEYHGEEQILSKEWNHE